MGEMEKMDKLSATSIPDTEITTFRPAFRPPLPNNQKKRPTQRPRQPKQVDDAFEVGCISRSVFDYDVDKLTETWCELMYDSYTFYFQVELIDDGFFADDETTEKPGDRETEPTTTTSTTSRTTSTTTTTTTTTTATTTTRRPTTTGIPVLPEYDDSYEDEKEDPTIELTTTLSKSGVTKPTIIQEAFEDEYFDADFSSEEERSNGESDEGVLKHNTKSMTFYHCLFGGYGPSGPMAGVGHVGAVFMNNRRRAPIIAPLPPSFPLGSQGVFTTIYKKTLFACSPGAAIDNPQFFSFFAQGERAFQPGQCYIYKSKNKAWEPFSSPMNSYRGGASLTRMGRFIVASGGNRFPAPLSSIEVLNTRKPERWKTLSKLKLPNPTYDHCTVAVNKTTIFITGGYNQESQAIMIDLARKKYSAMDAMIQPRRKVRLMLQVVITF